MKSFADRVRAVARNRWMWLKEILRRAAPNGGPPPIQYSLDSLGEQPFLTTGVVPVAGWTCSEAGIAAVELYLDDVFLKRIPVGQSRPDVGGAFPYIPGAARSGFSESVNLLGERCGNRTLALVIHDGTGQTVRAERPVCLVAHETFYHRYYLASLPTPEEEAQLLDQAGEGEKAVSFQLWLVVEREDAAGLPDTIASIESQAYPHWRLHLLPRDGAEVDWPRHDTRITLASAEDLRRQPSGAPSYVAFLRAGETLAPGALSRVATYLHAHPETSLLYSDHDRIKPGGLHSSPSFKPDWSPDHLLSRDYLGGVFFLRQLEESLQLFARIAEAGAPAWRYALLLRTSELPHRVEHLPHVLWSEPFRTESGHEGEAEAVREAVLRRGWRADVLETDTPGVRRLRWQVERQPKVSIIIPTTGNPVLVRPCVESLLEKTEYRNFELVFIDNGRGRYPEGNAYLRGQGLTVLERDEPFNWAKLNNDGARESDGELLLFLNDDIEVVDGRWLGELVAQACREEIGCVGAMLLYPDGLIQHAGVFLVDHGGGARHFLRGEPRDAPAYEELHRVVREVSSNTGACLMLRRELFERLGGFDEALTIAGNDIDLCLRARDAGFRNLWTPHSQLVHHESVSRRDINILDDEGKMWDRWSALLRSGDPYYNLNLSPNHTDCSLNVELLKQRERSRRPAAGPSAEGPGLNLIGYIKAEMGVGEALRGLASACHVAGVAFDVYNYEHGNPARMEDETWAHKITDQPGHAVNLLQVNADLIVNAWNGLPASLRERRYSIAHWVWELTEFPDEWRQAFGVVNEVWAPSRFVQDAVAMKSPVPVLRVPYVVEKKKQPYLDRRYFGLPEDRFLFLMMYDSHSIRERKNPAGAIAAFKRAFAEDDARTGLVIKINNANEQELATLAELIEDHPGIYLLPRQLSRYEVDSLIHGCDTFVSLHRSEGFGLVLAEAMALGTPVIGTNWSGNTDFMNQTNSACVEYRLVALDQGHGPYRAGQIWADPDVEHAAWWMRRIHEDQELRDTMTKRAVRDIAELLSARHVGALIAGRLRNISTRY
jgi:GT2 family glycosyltransferase